MGLPSPAEPLLSEARRANDAIAIEQDARFAIREGNKTVGSGIITRILD
ncbi:hypothetical protein ACMDCR_21965 [Labrys okinawensis]